MSLTNVTFPDADTGEFKEAVAFYGFENFNHFFRSCAHALIQHRRRGARLLTPLSFEPANSYATKQEKTR
jgi:hypothetical protein